MANAGVREFLTTLDQSLVDIDAVISDLAKEDCDDIEVHIAVAMLSFIYVQGDSTQESQPSPYLFSLYMDQSQNPLAW